MAFRTPLWSLADAHDEEETSEESDVDQSDIEDEEEDHSESATTSSYNDSPIASFGGSTTTGISSMDASEHMRAVNSNCTLDDFFHEEQLSDEHDSKLDIDEGFVTEKPLDVDVNFVINLTSQQTQATPQAAALSTPVPTQTDSTSQTYAPLKHFLRPICTVGTGKLENVVNQNSFTHF